MSLLLALVIAAPFNEGPEDMGRRLHDCVAAKDAECLFASVVREERLGHKLDKAQYKKLMAEYVFPFIGAPVSQTKIEARDGRTMKLYGQWAYGIEAEATRSYTTKSGGQIRLSFEIVSGASTGYKASGVIGGVLDATYSTRKSREANPSLVEATRSRYLTLKEDSAKLSKFGLTGVWTSPKAGVTPWPTAIAKLKSQLKSYGVEVD